MQELPNASNFILFPEMQPQFCKEDAIKIVDQRISTNLRSGEHVFSFRGKEYIVFPNVFSPAFFPNTHWFTEQFLQLIQHVPAIESFLEIGAGAGNVLIEVALTNKCKALMGTDINEVAVENFKLNLKKFGVEAQAVVSDVLEQIAAERKFDLIYWNYPFHFSEEKQYESMDLIEKSLRDPKYEHLEKLLKTAKSRLLGSGRIIISFSYQLGNLQKLKDLVDFYGWNYKTAVERQGEASLLHPPLCLVELTPR